MKINEMEWIVLAKLKESSKLYNKTKQYYKLGINDKNIFLIEDELSGGEPSVKPISRYDLLCIYKLENGHVKTVAADEFFGNLFGLYYYID